METDTRIKMDIAAFMAVSGKSMAELGALLGMSRGTIYARYRNPGTFSLNEYRELYRIIGKWIRLAS